MEVLIDKDRFKRNEDRVVTALLRTKLEDMEFHNFINDVFRFMRDGIIAKHSSTDFPNGSEDLLSDNEEDEDEEDTMTTEESNKSVQEKETALTKARDGHLKASTFITLIGLDPSLVLDMYESNKNKLFISKKVTNPKNVKALGEIRTALFKLHEGNTSKSDYCSGLRALYRPQLPRQMQKPVKNSSLKPPRNR